MSERHDPRGVIIVGGSFGLRHEIASMVMASESCMLVAQSAEESVFELWIDPPHIGGLVEILQANHPDGWYRQFEKRNARRNFK